MNVNRLVHAQPPMSGNVGLWYLERPLSIYPPFPLKQGLSSRLVWVGVLIISYLRRKRFVGEGNFAHQPNELRRMSSFKARSAVLA